MPEHKHVTVAGRTAHVFAHRFTVEAAGGRIWLADLGPKGAEAFTLEAGIEVSLEGEMKPSELKVTRIVRRGAAAVTIEHHKKHGPHDHGPRHHGPPHHQHDEPAEPKVAMEAVVRAGLDPIGTPRRKPKHFEVLARKGDRFFECHVELDGHIRKEKPVAPDDHKWFDEIRAAA